MDGDKRDETITENFEPIEQNFYPQPVTQPIYQPVQNQPIFQPVQNNNGPIFQPVQNQQQVYSSTTTTTSNQSNNQDFNTGNVQVVQQVKQQPQLDAGMNDLLYSVIM